MHLIVRIYLKQTMTANFDDKGTLSKFCFISELLHGSYKIVDFILFLVAT